MGAHPLVLPGTRWNAIRIPIREAIPLCFTPNGLIGLLLGAHFFGIKSMSCNVFVKPERALAGGRHRAETTWYGWDDLRSGSPPGDSLSWSWRLRPLR